CIVFLHGNGFSKEVFSQQFSSTYLAHMRLISLDLPGHGRSSNANNPKKTYSYAGFANEIIDFLELKRIKRCVVAGWSLGGQIALEMVDRSPLVRGVFAFGAPPAPSGPLGLMRSMKFCRSLLLAGKSQFSEAEAEYFEKMAFGDHAKGKYKDQLLRTDPEMRPHLSRSLLLPSGISQYERFTNSSTPICLAHGLGEPLIRTQYMEGLTSPALFGGNTAFLENAGHAPFVQTPDEFDLLLRFFSEWVQTGALELPYIDQSNKVCAAA
ncbi:MAG: alpha/beta hydrolase, partial [Pseudomonadota bacterium]